MSISFWISEDKDYTLLTDVKTLKKKHFDLKILEYHNFKILKTFWIKYMIFLKRPRSSLF